MKEMAANRAVVGDGAAGIELTLPSSYMRIAVPISRTPYIREHLYKCIPYIRDPLYRGGTI